MSGTFSRGRSLVHCSRGIVFSLVESAFGGRREVLHLPRARAPLRVFFHTIFSSTPFLFARDIMGPLLDWETSHFGSCRSNWAGAL